MDTEPLVLRCGTRLYRAVFGDKQATCWYSTSYPTAGSDSENPIDLRKALGITPLRHLTPAQFQLAAAKSLLELRQGSLQMLLSHD